MGLSVVVADPLGESSYVVVPSPDSLLVSGAVDSIKKWCQWIPIDGFLFLFFEVAAFDISQMFLFIIILEICF